MNPERKNHSDHPPTLGVVSFLNAKPLIAGLETNPQVSLRFAVPSALPDMLRQQEVRVALIPVVDLARNEAEFNAVSDACIGSDGPTMTVRVFSRVQPKKMTTLYVDQDSHTSVVLSRLIWQEVYGRSLDIRPLASADASTDCESIMLIGDKVVAWAHDGFPHQLDLGVAWRQMTGLPFVFAVWAGRRNDDVRFLEPLLTDARDRGVRQAAQIAADQGPKLGWPVESATQYLVDCLKYRFDQRMHQGMSLFLQMARQQGHLPENPKRASA